MQPTVTTGQIVNVREGPGTAYAVLGQITPGNTYNLVGKNEAGDWWQIDTGSGKGWVINQLVDASGDGGEVAVVTDIPEPAVAARQRPAPAESGGCPGPGCRPVVSAPPPSGGIPFGYGVQAHMVHNGDMINQVMGSTKGMGFNWVKQQIEWKVFEGSPGSIDFGSADRDHQRGQRRGHQCALQRRECARLGRVSPASTAASAVRRRIRRPIANFLGALAGKYCGTSLKVIEVWNEQNLHYEWGNKPLNPGEYVQLLAPAYAAIKAACPSM